MKAPKHLDPEFIRNHFPKPDDRFQTRRQFLNRFGLGLGALSLGTILGEQMLGAAEAPPADAAALAPLSPRKAPLNARARHVVHIFAQGAPSQVDTWDPKPAWRNTPARRFPE